MTEPRKTPRCDAIKEYQFPSLCYALEIETQELAEALEELLSADTPIIQERAEQALARHRAKQEAPQ